MTRWHIPTQVRSSDSNSIAHWLRSQGDSRFLLTGSNSAQPVRKMVSSFLTKLNISHEAITDFLDIYANKLKFYIHMKTCMWVLRPLFTTGKHRMPRTPFSSGGSLWDSYPMDYYFSPLKRAINHKETEEPQMGLTEWQTPMWSLHYWGQQHGSLGKVAEVIKRAVVSVDSAVGDEQVEDR